MVPVAEIAFRLNLLLCCSSMACWLHAAGSINLVSVI